MAETGGEGDEPEKRRREGRGKTTVSAFCVFYDRTKRTYGTRRGSCGSQKKPDRSPNPDVCEENRKSDLLQALLPSPLPHENADVQIKPLIPLYPIPPWQIPQLGILVEVPHFPDIAADGRDDEEEDEDLDKRELEGERGRVV
jgi:hypothetical protein